MQYDNSHKNFDSYLLIMCKYGFLPRSARFGGILYYPIKIYPERQTDIFFIDFKIFAQLPHLGISCLQGYFKVYLWNKKTCCSFIGSVFLLRYAVIIGIEIIKGTLHTMSYIVCKILPFFFFALYCSVINADETVPIWGQR